ncbi:class I SAM-dependent methyltransferase [Litoribacter ruber]|uniref:class I SAM-dependent methyltransferase n=1 Tax=Litoribacter ruber TaxID=702568 RepID=UPI001BDA05A5|nr:class I SAM-dependent methyltransferase [Litoribacter ruber]MBT0813036.1 class I SAM-dependent methyltransferase [Litoribacter ruber]
MLKILKRKLYKYFHKRFVDVQNNIEKQIPKYDLERKHILRLETLSNRSELLERLTKNGVVAEIGVNKGSFSKEILEKSNPQELFLIDAWDSGRYHGGLRKVVETTFEKDIAVGRVQIHQGYSTEMASKFSDGFFDWIYIDTDHSYSVTRDELQAYKHKIKPGGIIAGHDYIQGNWGRILRYGVMEAVHEFCVQEDWELVFLTTEMSNSPSFAIRKITS